MHKLVMPFYDLWKIKNEDTKKEEISIREMSIPYIRCYSTQVVMLSIQILNVDIGGRMIFKVGGGANRWSWKWHVSTD